jgi:hypothetical protein
LPDQSNSPTAGRDVLVLRAVFVPDGGQPPPEFINDLHPLRIPCTYNRKTGEITCRDAGLNFDGDIRAEFHPDVAPDQGSGDVSANPNGAGQPGQAAQPDQAATDSNPLALNSGWRPSYPRAKGGGSQTGQGSWQTSSDAQETSPGNAVDDAATGAAGMASNLPQPGNPASSGQATNSIAPDAMGASMPGAANQPPLPDSEFVQPTPAGPGLDTGGPSGDRNVETPAGAANSTASETEGVTMPVATNSPSLPITGNGQSAPDGPGVGTDRSPWGRKR